MPTYNNVNYLSLPQQVEKNRTDIQTLFTNQTVIFTTETAIELLTFLDRSSLVDTGKTPKEGDLIFGSDSYFGQITGVSDNLVEFTIVGRIENLNEIIDGKKYKVVSGVIRNSGSGWELIDDSKHDKINVSSVTNGTSTIVINFTFIAKQVISFIIAPDETFASEGILCGASVGLSSAIVQIKQNRTIGGYVSFNGTAWTVLGFSGSASFSAGILTITHPETDYDGDAVGGSANCRNGVYVANLGTVGKTTTEVYIRDYAGNLVTTPDTNMKIFFVRTPKGNITNPANVINAGGNFWFYGVFEVE